MTQRYDPPTHPPYGPPTQPGRTAHPGYAGQLPYPAAPPPPKKGGALKWILIIGVILAVMVGCMAVLAGGGHPGAPATGGPAATEEDKQPAAEDRLPGLGDTVEDGKFAFKVTKLGSATKVGVSEFLNKKAQGQFILVYVTVKNIGTEAQSFFGANQKLFDAKGREYSADSEAAIYLANSKSLYEEVNPGNSVRGVVLFDVPKGTKPATLELHDSAFSMGAKVALQ